MITLKDVQQRLGVVADGRYGPVTLAAIVKALGIEEARHTLGNPKAFFADIRDNITGPLDQVQVDVINSLFASASHWPASWLAYGLATAWHEAELRPIDEIGKGRGRKYGVPGKYAGQVPYGRGLVQLTWDANYVWADKISAEAGLTLPGEILANFELVKRPDIAVLILVKGMETGAFTGVSLANRLPEPLADHGRFVQARPIINGTDKASLIAGYALEFQSAIYAGAWA